MKKRKNVFAANSAFVSNGGTLWLNKNNYDVIFDVETINEPGIEHKAAPAGCPAMDLPGSFESMLEAEKALARLGYFYEGVKPCRDSCRGNYDEGGFACPSLRPDDSCRLGFINI
jgi:hypothetical protein